MIIWSSECDNISILSPELWDVIINGDLEEEPAPTGDQSGPSAPKTAKQLAARRNQERVKSILLLAIPDEYLIYPHLENEGFSADRWRDLGIDLRMEGGSLLTVRGTEVHSEDRREFGLSKKNAVF
ncbi:hypothetical protein Tco_0123892 [Tanacetum coccineum]